MELQAVIILVIFLGILTGIAFKGFDRIKKSTGQDETVETYIEMMPVLGLVFTLTCAGVIHYILDIADVENILLAASASLMAWVYYVFMKLKYIAGETGKYFVPPETFKSAQDFRTLCATIKGDIKGVVEFMIQINEQVRSITTTINTLDLKRKIADLRETVTVMEPLNDQVERYLKSLEELGHLAAQPYQFSFKHDLDEDKQFQVEQFTRTMRILSEQKNTHNFFINSHFNQDDLVANIVNITQSLSILKKLPSVYNLQVNLNPETNDMSRVIAQITKELASLAKATTEYPFQIRLISGTNGKPVDPQFLANTLDVIQKNLHLLDNTSVLFG